MGRQGSIDYYIAGIVGFCLLVLWMSVHLFVVVHVKQWMDGGGEGDGRARARIWWVWLTSDIGHVDEEERVRFCLGRAGEYTRGWGRNGGERPQRARQVVGTPCGTRDG